MASKKIIAILCLMSFIVISCNTEDDTTIQINQLNGIWHLKNVGGGMAGNNVSYSKGEVIWVFNEKSQEIRIENNTDPNSTKGTFSIYRSGNYSYRLVENNTSTSLYIADEKLGVYYFEDGQLNVDGGLAFDGLFYMFVK